MNRQRLQAGLDELAMTVSAEQIDLLQNYTDLLMRWNKVYNLTAIKDADQMLPLHLFDSLAVAPYLQGKNCLDVGSGAGLPGIPLAIVQPERQFTLLDTVGKKTRFMQQAVIQLKLPNVSVTQARVESWSPKFAFDAIISRAFASINDFVSLTAHHLKPQGTLYAMKGRYPAQEMTQLPAAYQVVAETKLQVPELDAERYLIEIRQSQTVKTQQNAAK